MMTPAQDKDTGRDQDAADMRNPMCAPAEDHVAGAPANGNDDSMNALGETPLQTDFPAHKDVLHFNLDADEEDADIIDDADDRPVEQILFQRDFCLRTKHGECSRCEAACPVDAISYGGDSDLVIIDNETCTRCGICYGICDAFTSTRSNVIDLRSRIARMSAVDKVLFVTCRENIFSDTDVADDVLVVPCLASLSPELLASVIMDGVRIIVAGNLGYCDTCKIAPDRGEMLYTYAFETVESWTGRQIEFVDEVPEQAGLMDRVNQNSRRDALSGLLSAVGDVASGHYRSKKNSAQEEYDRASESLHAMMAELITTSFLAFNRAGKAKTWFPRREFLVEAALANPHIARRIPLQISDTDIEACKGAHDCVASCITGARGIDDEGYLTFDSRYCIGCGICEDACKQHACSLTDITADRLRGEVRIIGQSATASNDAVDRANEPQRKMALDADAFYQQDSDTHGGAHD